MEDTPSDAEEREPTYESDKQSERNVNSPSVASISSKLLHPTSVRGHGAAIPASALQSMTSAKSRQARDEALVADYSELKVWLHL